MNETQVITHESVTFILEPQRTICKTKHQTFVLISKQHRWRRNYLKVRAQIINNRLTNMVQVVDVCHDKIDIRPSHD